MIQGFFRCFIANVDRKNVKDDLAGFIEIDSPGCGRPIRVTDVKD